MSRLAYLDWLRGVAVLVMIEAHTVDSWTRLADRSGAFGWALVVGGFGAPLFLFLAGVAVALAAGSRRRAGLGDAAIAALARRRGWQIFGLALLFRLQSALISGGALPQALLKVDILNVMGVSMLVAGGLWARGRGPRWRAFLLVLATAAVAMLTPIVRATPLLAALPDPIEWYFRPFQGRTTFALFPWAGFLLAGAAIGLWLDASRTPPASRRVMTRLALVGPAMALAGYAASFLPPIYPDSSFWTSSPTFFFLRLGILIGVLPVAYAWNALFRGWSPLQDLGIASLFVYWIHVEMVYGVPSVAIHRGLTFEKALLAFGVFSLCMFGLVKLKDGVRNLGLNSQWLRLPARKSSKGPATPPMAPGPG